MCIINVRWCSVVVSANYSRAKKSLSMSGHNMGIIIGGKRCWINLLFIIHRKAKTNFNISSTIILPEFEFLKIILDRLVLLAKVILSLVEGIFEERKLSIGRPRNLIGVSLRQKLTILEGSLNKPKKCAKAPFLYLSNRETRRRNEEMEKSSSG